MKLFKILMAFAFFVFINTTNAQIIVHTDDNVQMSYTVSKESVMCKGANPNADNYGKAVHVWKVEVRLKNYSNKELQADLNTIGRLDIKNSNRTQIGLDCNNTGYKHHLQSKNNLDDSPWVQISMGGSDMIIQPFETKIGYSYYHFLEGEQPIIGRWNFGGYKILKDHDIKQETPKNLNSINNNTLEHKTTNSTPKTKKQVIQTKTKTTITERQKKTWQPATNDTNGKEIIRIDAKGKEYNPQQPNNLDQKKQTSIITSNPQFTIGRNTKKNKTENRKKDISQIHQDHVTKNNERYYKWKAELNAKKQKEEQKIAETKRRQEILLVQQKKAYQEEQKRKQDEILKNIENQKLEYERTQQAYDRLGDEVGAELGEIFSGELKPQSIMNITESILNSGLLKTIDGIGAVGIGGGVLAAGVGILQEAKQNKIKNNANSIKEQLGIYKAENKIFKEYVNSNDDIALLKSHNELLKIELKILESVNYLINKADQTDLKKLKKNIEESRSKRNRGVNAVKEKIIYSFHYLSANEKQRFAQSNTLSLEEINELKRPTKTTGHVRYYHENWELLQEGSFKYGKQHGLWNVYDSNKNLINRLLFNSGAIEYGIEFFSNGKIKAISNTSQYQSYHENGNTNNFGKLENNKKSGIWSVYNENGTLSRLVKLKNGIEMGEDIHFYNNGEKRNEFYLKNGQRDSIANWYYDNGKLKHSMRYKSIITKNNGFLGLRMEVLASFDKLGNPLDKGNLLNGDGYVIEYDENGNLFRISYYKNGILKKDIRDQEKILNEFNKYKKKYSKGNNIDIEKHTTYSLEVPKLTHTLLEEVINIFSKNKTKHLKTTSIQTNDKQTQNKTSQEEKTLIGKKEKNKNVQLKKTTNNNESYPSNNPKDLIFNSIEQLGSFKIINNIKTIQLESKMVVSNDFTENIVMEAKTYRKYPNLYRTEVKVEGVDVPPTIQTFDGKNGKIYSNGNEVELDENTLNQLKSCTHIIEELNYFKHIKNQDNVQISTIKSNSIDYQKISFNYTDDMKMDLYINEKNLLIEKSIITPLKSSTNYSKIINVYEDFQVMGDLGILYPKINKQTIYDKNGKILTTITTTLLNVKENIELKDSVFNKKKYK